MKDIKLIAMLVGYSIFLIAGLMLLGELLGMMK